MAAVCGKRPTPLTNKKMYPRIKINGAAFVAEITELDEKNM